MDDGLPNPLRIDPKDNPLAFPIIENGDNSLSASYGMSLLDYFAARAPIQTGEVVKIFMDSNNGRNPTFHDVFNIRADMCYRHAEAMLAARKRILEQ